MYELYGLQVLNKSIVGSGKVTPVRLRSSHQPFQLTWSNFLNFHDYSTVSKLVNDSEAFPARTALPPLHSLNHIADMSLEV